MASSLMPISKRKAVISDQYTKYGKFSEEADDTENGFFRSSNIPKDAHFEDANKKARKKATGPDKIGRQRRGAAYSAKMKHLRQLERNRRHQNRVTFHSGPNKKITDNVKDGPFSNNTGSNSNAKHGPKMKHTSKKAPRRKYYRPSDDTKTFQINSKGHLQCLHDPKLIHRPNDKGKLPGSRESPMYH